MKHRATRFLAVFLSLVLIVGTMMAAVSAEDSTTVTFEDSFDGSKADQYTPYGMWWNSAAEGHGTEGTLTNEGGTGDGWAFYWLKDLIWKDITVEFDVVEQNSSFGVVLRAGNPGAGADSAMGYAVMYDLNWAFFGNMNGVWRTLNTDSGHQLDTYPTECQPEGGKITHWKIECIGEEIKVYFNNAETPSMAMKADLYEQGAFGFRCFAPAGKISNVIDNLKITGTAGEQKPAGPAIVDPEVYVVYSDEFDGSKAGDYTPYGIWWNGADGEQVLVNEGGTFDGWTYYYLNNEYDNFEMEFDLISQANAFGAVLRANNPGAGPDDGDAYTVMNDTNWVFFGRLNGQFTGFDGFAEAVDGIPVATPGNDKTTNTHWRIVCDQNKVYVYFNGSEAPAMAMSADDYFSGKVGFRAFAPAGQVAVIVDNLKISEIPSTEPETPVEPPVVDPETPVEPPIVDPAPPVDPPVVDPETPVEPPVEEPKTYTDEFDGSKGGNYDVHGIWWNSEWNGNGNAGTLTAMGGGAPGFSYYYLKDQQWSDFTMEFDVIDQNNSLGVMLRASDPGPGPDQGNGYAVIYDGAWAFVSNQNGSFNQIQTAADGYGYACPPSSTENCHWVITCEGNKITATINGATLCVTDDTWTTGQIGFRAFCEAGQNPVAIIDNLKITEIVKDTVVHASEEAPAEEAVIEETPAEETPVVEPSAEEIPTEETPAEEAPAEEALAEEVTE